MQSCFLYGLPSTYSVVFISSFLSGFASGIISSFLNSFFLFLLYWISLQTGNYCSLSAPCQLFFFSSLLPYAEAPKVVPVVLFSLNLAPLLEPSQAVYPLYPLNHPC